MNKFEVLLRKFREAIAAGKDRDETEAKVLAHVMATGRGEFNSIEELERAGMEGIERDLDASETRLGNLARGAAQSLTVGLSDELAGVARGLNPFDDIKGFGAGYESGKQEATAKLERGRRENPVASFIGEMAGAVVPGVGAMRTASMIPKVGRALRNPKLLPRVTRSGLEPGRLASTAGLGAVEGGAYGFGAGEGGIEGRMESAETGAKFGGVVGGVLPVLPLVGGALRRQGARGGTIQETLQEGIEGVRPRRVDLGTSPRTERGPRGLLDSPETQLEPVRNRRRDTVVKLREDKATASKAYDTLMDANKKGWTDASTGPRMVEFEDGFKFYEHPDGRWVDDLDNPGDSWPNLESLKESIKKYDLGATFSGGPGSGKTTDKIEAFFKENLNRKGLGPRSGWSTEVEESVEAIDDLLRAGGGENLPLREAEEILKHMNERARTGLGRSRPLADELKGLIDDVWPDMPTIRSNYNLANVIKEAYDAGAGHGLSKSIKARGRTGLFSKDKLSLRQDLLNAMDELVNDSRITSLPKAQQEARKAAVERQFLDGVWDRFSRELEGGTDKEGITKLYKLTRGEGKEWFREFFEEGPKGDRAFRQAMNIVEDITPFRERHKLLYNFMRMAAIFGAARAAFASGESGLLGTIDPF
tara:strand:+ start:2274 stop:4217 length:1944 start_codon:yes stop_codon:yes gene_type:complete